MNDWPTDFSATGTDMGTDENVDTALSGFEQFRAEG